MPSVREADGFDAGYEVIAPTSGLMRAWIGWIMVRAWYQMDS
jgi:hypothetical protein